MTLENSMTAHNNYIHCFYAFYCRVQFSKKNNCALYYMNKMASLSATPAEEYVVLVSTTQSVLLQYYT